MQWTDRIRQVKISLVVAAVLIAVASLVVSHFLIRDLENEERGRMEVWAEAMRTLSTADGNTDLNLVLKVINGNNTIPVVVMDPQGRIQTFRNVPVSAKTGADSLRHVEKVARQMKAAGNSIRILMSDSVKNDYIDVVFDESLMLKRLSWYPFVQLGVVLTFVVVAVFALLTSKRAEQNKVWVGLSKETAHQLGTPISSLMAWTQLLSDMGVDREMVGEMEKDVNRLSMIASRFSKIGSRPQMETDDLNTVVGRAASYMQTRISSRIRLTVNLCPTPLPVEISAPLFEWVMETLIKNAVDAMEGSGSITVDTLLDNNHATVTVTDTGKGIDRKNRKTVFNPGYTTKKRGWGLGLTLVKRIVEEYHGGRIYVKESELGKGTTFRIEFPMAQ